MTDRAYKRPLNKGWWHQHPWHKFYMLREMTSVPIALYMLNLSWGLAQLNNGENAWQAWLNAQSSLPLLILGLLAFAAACYHSYTWFAIAPKAMPGYVAGKKVPHKAVTIAHYAGAITIALLAIVLVWGL
jgi:fumarate reductase subunit C